jgi:hypothetical protein
MEIDGGYGELTAYLDYTKFKMMVYQQPVKYIINRKEEEEEEACKARRVVRLEMKTKSVTLASNNFFL